MAETVTGCTTPSSGVTFAARGRRHRRDTGERHLGSANEIRQGTAGPNSMVSATRPSGKLSNNKTSSRRLRLKSVCTIPNSSSVGSRTSFPDAKTKRVAVRWDPSSGLGFAICVGFEGPHRTDRNLRHRRSASLDVVQLDPIRRQLDRAENLSSTDSAATEFPAPSHCPP